MKSKPVRLRRKIPRRLRAPYVKKPKRDRANPKRRPRAIAACARIKEIIEAAANPGIKLFGPVAIGCAVLTGDEMEKIYALACLQPETWKPEGPK